MTNTNIPLVRGKLARLVRNRSLRETAKRAKVAYSDLSKWENLKAIPGPDQAARWAGVLGLNPEELQELVNNSSEEAR